MIFDSIRNARRYADVHARFRAAFEFLLKVYTALPDDGRYPVDGEKVFALVSSCKGKGKKAAVLEAHRKYIDIQYVAGGNELIGLQTADHCKTIKKVYDEHKDIIFYGDRPAEWLSMPAGSFAIFYPQDAHAPLAGRGMVKKIVIKVAVD